MKILRNEFLTPTQRAIFDAVDAASKKSWYGYLRVRVENGRAVEILVQKESDAPLKLESR
jgi:hypothetical protein